MFDSCKKSDKVLLFICKSKYFPYSSFNKTTQLKGHRQFKSLHLQTVIEFLIQIVKLVLIVTPRAIGHHHVC